jgi:glycosyl transferase family 1
MVGANKGFPSRKGFPEAFEAFARLRQSVPQARLYVHSHVASTYGGPNLHHLAELSGIAAYVRFPDQYHLGVGLGAEYMAIAYNAMDVLLQASSHEGFGLPMLEAQACGVPVVAVDSTSMRELVAPAYGALVGSLQRQLTTLMSWVAVPDVRGLARALERVYKQPPGAMERELLRSWAAQYAWPTVAEHYWKPMLDQVAEQLDAPTSQDRALKAALQQAEVLEPPAADEGDRHGCCCQHVVEQLQAMPAAPDEVLYVATGKLQQCPHHDTTNWLEAFIAEARREQEIAAE